MTTVTPGRYRHFKGNLYDIIGIARHSETQRQHVVYQSVETGEWWVRPLAMFTETVEHEGKQVPRFERVDE